MRIDLSSRSVRPELVEGLPFLSEFQKKGVRGFDRLSPNGPYQ
jgi:hypothetical protein